MAEKEETLLEEESPETNKKGFPVKLVVFAFVLILAVGGGLFAWKGGLLETVLKEKPDQASASLYEEEDDKSDIGPIYSLETFIVNLADPRGKRYLKAKLELECNGEELTMEIDRRLPQFRDTILTVLSSKTYEDINNLEGKYQLRAEIMSLLNQYLKTGKIKNIYLTEFIVQ